MSEYTIDLLKQITSNKNVYIYAANVEGAGFCRMFLRLGINVKGFIDSRNFKYNQKLNLPVIHPNSFFSSDFQENSFVLIATKHREYKKIAIDECEKIGLTKNQGFIIATELCDYFPTIEVVGSCNLKCISCDMGQPNAKQNGLMSPQNYRKTLSKMIKDIPLLNSVCLYQWGEPFLHPQLPEIIKISSELGVACEISSNLNYGRFIEPIIMAEPDIINIPCSGIKSNYELTHTKGNWETFLSNLYLVRQLIDKHNADTVVRIYYHMYKHNLEEDFDFMEKLAGELNFSFNPILANLFPGKVYDYTVNNIDIPVEMKKANELLIYQLDEQLEYAYSNRHLKCPIIKAFPNVCSDGSVINCCNMTGPILHMNYLDIDHNDLIKLRNADQTCGKCISKGVHRFFEVNAIISINEGKRFVTRN